MTLAAFRAELTAAKAAAVPVFEGLSDYLAVNLTQEARAKVQEIALSYQQRMQAIENTLQALIALEGAGYPADITSAVEDVVYADLQAQQASITAALGKFTKAAPEAASGAISFDRPAKRV
jgi:GTP:adenosylcobinamide-phosphate guanylyltransferase